MANRLDGWMNAWTGIGDKFRDALAGAAMQVAAVTDTEAENLFAGDYLANTICARPVNDATRKWVSLQIEPGDDASDDERAEAPKLAAEVIEDMRRLGARDKFAEAGTWARMSGGCLILVGAEDGLDPSQELDLDRVQSVDFLNVIEKDGVTVEANYEDPTEPRYGEPMLYRLRNVGNEDRVVHESRILRFDGELTSKQRRAANSGWGDGVLVRLRDVLQRNGQSWQSVGHLLAKSNTMVFKLDGFSDLIGGMEGALEAWQTRMRANKMSMSANSWVAVDREGEEVENIAVNLGGVSDILDRFMIEVSAATGIPVAILWGRSPAGENSTGDSDWKNWDDFCTAYQESKLRDKLERLAEIVMAAKAGPTAGQVPESWALVFNPLREPDPKETAEIRKADAETAALYIEAGVYTEDEVALSRFGEQGYQQEITIDLSMRRERAAARRALELEMGDDETEPPEPGDDPKDDPEAKGDDTKKVPANAA